ncbi:MAG: hypothetical protein AAGA06_09385 [Pseudomonadota bacterium]
MLRLKKLARRNLPQGYLKQSVRDEVASIGRADALEAYICGKRRKLP